MNREQIIEEMARKIQQGELLAQRDMSYHENFNFDTVVKIGQQRLYGAKALYEDNYQKIAEGSVVLTEEEIEEMKEQARKEKAAEILNKIANIDDCGFPLKSYVWFNELAKENGVEVK